MSVLDFSPSPAAAPMSRRLLAHGRMEGSLIARNGEQMTLALVIPVALLIGGRVLHGRLGISEATMAPSVIGLAIWSTTFTSLAIATGFERRYGVLERLSATPLGHGGLLAGKAIGITSISALQVALLCVVGVALGWRPHPSAEGMLMLLAIPLAAIAFSALALCSAGTLRAELTLALANLVYLVGLVGGGIIWPLSSYPAGTRWIVGALPTAALGESLRAWSAGSQQWWTLPVLAAWAVILGLVARKVFRWTS